MASNYENNYIKYYTRKLLKESLENLTNQKIIEYTKEAAKRNEMEKFFIRDNKFIISKKL
jgi:hypothetical protein